MGVGWGVGVGVGSGAGVAVGSGVGVGVGSGVGVGVAGTGVGVAVGATASRVTAAVGVGSGVGVGASATGVAVGVGVGVGAGGIVSPHPASITANSVTAAMTTHVFRRACMNLTSEGLSVRPAALVGLQETVRDAYATGDAFTARDRTSLIHPRAVDLDRRRPPVNETAIQDQSAHPICRTGGTEHSNRHNFAGVASLSREDFVQSGGKSTSSCMPNLDKEPVRGSHSATWWRSLGPRPHTEVVAEPILQPTMTPPAFANRPRTKAQSRRNIRSPQ